MIANLGTIIKLILVNKLMIRNEMVHGAVPRFRNVVWVLRIALFSISAVNRLFDNSPSQIVVWKLSFLNRAWGWECCHYTSKWDQLIMQVSRMIQRRAFIGDLQTALAHTKRHCIHIDLTWIRFSFAWLIARFFVLKQRNSNAYLFSPVFTDWFYKASKPRMRVYGFINRKLWARELINTR